ncbi:MAG TPA: ATP-binding cassette domain-containing protein [Fimbriimonas sp.]|nr:ATP-binding cassette domain-containing protein [Fimbriimonas sp.]
MSYGHTLGETLLSVEGISLTLGGKLILRDVGFEVKNIERPNLEQGQVVGLLGPSGMGKTQLFRILSGLNIPDTGTVKIGPEAVEVRAGQVGVVAQNYPLLQHRRVLSNLAVAGQRAGLSAEEAKTHGIELLENFHLAEHADKYPVQLSGGQRQRVAIAQQFMCSNQLMLMDEPFSGLDPLALARMCDFIKSFAQTDELKTFIIVTHDIASAVEVCDTLLLLGRDHDAEGNPIPGARIQHNVDLIARGLAWRPDISRTQEFAATINEVKDLFAKL